MRIPDTPLFVKTHDFLLWLLQRTQRFPKHLRHSYTLKVETMALDFQEAILMANTVRGSEQTARNYMTINSLASKFSEMSRSIGIPRNQRVN